MIDDKRIDREGKWVWPREKFAQMVNRLSDADAKGTGFDVGFLEPDRNSALLQETLCAVSRFSTREDDISERHEHYPVRAYAGDES